MRGLKLCHQKRLFEDSQKDKKTSEDDAKELVKEIAKRFLKELKGETHEHTLEVEVIENPNPTKEGKDKYTMIAKL